MFKKFKIPNFTGRINAFRVIERLERMNISGGQNTESVKFLFWLSSCSIDNVYLSNFNQESSCRRTSNKPVVFQLVLNGGFRFFVNKYNLGSYEPKCVNFNEFIRIVSIIPFQIFNILDGLLDTSRVIPLVLIVIYSELTHLGSETSIWFKNVVQQ